MTGFLVVWSRVGAAVPDLISAPGLAAVAARGDEPLRRTNASGAQLQTARCVADDPGATELPLRGADDSWAVGQLRLDGRATLRAALRARGATVADSDSDLALAFAAWQCWGASCGAHLRGDLALCFGDPRRRTLTIVRGDFGVIPLFVAETPEWIVASNTIEAVREVRGVDTRIQEQAIAEFLRGGELATPSLTFHRGIQRIPSAHTQRVVDGALEPPRRHWRFPDPSPRLRETPDETIARFRGAMDAAVADRVRGGTSGILLSGGLDSPVIAATLRRVRPAQAVHASTSSYDADLAVDEGELARAVASRLGLTEHVVRTVRTSEALDWLNDRSIRTSEPVHEPELAVWRERARWFAERTSAVFYGEDGDAVLGAPTVPTMLRTLPWGWLASAWRTTRRRGEPRPWIGLRRSGPFVRRKHDASWRSPSWMRPEVVARFGSNPPPMAPSHRHRPLAAMALQSSGWESLHTLCDQGMTGARVRFVLPFLDVRVLTASFETAPIPWLQRKHILRAAYASELPPEIIRRPKTPVIGYFEHAVAAWRSRGAPPALPAVLSDWVDERSWQRVLAESPDFEQVVAGWRVLELARWLEQASA